MNSSNLAIPEVETRGSEILRPERLHALDSLRAVAMLLGIVLHAGAAFMVTPLLWPVHDAGRQAGFDALLGAIHGFRMQLFFLLAGFFGHLLWQRRGPRGFLRSRWQRIGIPFVLGMLTLIPLFIALWFWADSRTGDHHASERAAHPSLLGTPTGHLWFLLMLLILCGLTAALAWCVHRLRWQALLPWLDRQFDALMARPAKPLWLALPTVALLWLGPTPGEIDLPGQRLLPPWYAVAYFALFYAVGWWLHRRAHLLALLQRWNRAYLLLALAGFLVWGGCLDAHLAIDDPRYPALKLLAGLGAALYAWCLCFALTGLFLRHAGGYRAWMRYLADASYWCYLCHLPLVVVFQILWLDWAINPWLKLGLILLVTVAVLLPSYHWLVRYTWIGRILNGPRVRSTRAY